MRENGGRILSVQARSVFCSGGHPKIVKFYKKKIAQIIVNSTEQSISPAITEM